MTSKIKIYNPLTKKETNIDPYGRTAKNIYKYYIEEENKEPSTILPNNLTYINGKFIKVKTIEDNSNVRRLTYEKVKTDIGNSSSMTYLRNLFMKYKNQTIKVVKRWSDADFNFNFDDNTGEYTTDVDNIQEKEEAQIWSIPNNFSSWWIKHSHFFIINSDKELFGEWNEALDDPKLQAQLLILTLDKVEKENYNQYFLDGITHCFFYPIKEWAICCKDNSKSKSSENRYINIIKKVNKYIDKYDKGIPEEDLSNVCNDLQISVEIDLPSTIMGEDKFINIECQRKALKKFRFINTRLNHIELNEVNNKDDYEEKTQEEIKIIFENCTKNDEFILWKENINGITQINTIDKIYKLTNDDDSYIEIATEFENKYNFFNYKIEKNSNAELTDFLEGGLNCNQSITFIPECKYINSSDFIEDYLYDEEEKEEIDKILEGSRTDSVREARGGDINTPVLQEKKKLVDWINNLENLNHIDIKKAYTQGHNCSKYQGYLGKITDFRKTDKIVGLGIYKINNIKFNGSVIEKMNCFHNNQNYPSPELEFYKSLGITFDIIMGCWGSSFDFVFSEDMYKKEGGTPHYCKWYGCLMKTTDKERYNFNCKNIEFAKLNAYNTNNSIRYNYQQNSGIIEYEKKYIYHSYHIASFISSYARITLLEQILKFKNFNQIVSVIVDGIYYSGDVEIGELFSEKEKKSFKNNLQSDEYVPNYNLNKQYENIGDYRENNKIEVHLGAGGCGKTHNNIIDKGLINPLFIAPSWKLARNKKTEYGIESSVFYRILSGDPDKYKNIIRRYSVLIIDEISMLSNEEKEIIIDRFQEHKIIFCGDIGFQLPPIEGTEFKIGNLPVFKHTTNYRCNCKKLEKILFCLRNLISNSPNIYGNLNQIIEKLKFNIINEEDMNYSVEDLIICSTNKKKDFYTAKYKNLEKYSVLENTTLYSNGDIIIGPKPEKVRCELRHGWTIHSTQGITAKNKLFIDMNEIKTLKLLYTAVSRCRTLDQIYFVRE